IDDSPESIKKKIKNSFCPAGEIEGNPIIEIAKYFIYDKQDIMLIERPPKFGGNLELNYEELLKMYSLGDLHPLDLKNAVTANIIRTLKPVREYLKNQV
ncbi:MAG: tyrosine--tRNA ligase, partial [Methanobacterium sp.]